MVADSPSPFEAFDLAVTRVGGQSAMARVCGCTPGNINQLLQAKRPMPAEYVLRAELASGVSRHLLRPDIYPRGLVDDEPFEPGATPPGVDALVPGDDLLVIHGWAAAARHRAERQSAPSPEWPIAGSQSDGAENSKAEFQSAGGARAPRPTSNAGAQLAVGVGAAVDEASRRPAAAPLGIILEVGTCRICGCRDHSACEPFEYPDGTTRPCAWADATETLCDRPSCLDASARVDRGAPVEADVRSGGWDFQMGSSLRVLVDGEELPNVFAWSAVDNVVGFMPTDENGRKQLTPDRTDVIRDWRNGRVEVRWKKEPSE